MVALLEVGLNSFIYICVPICFFLIPLSFPVIGGETHRLATVLTIDELLSLHLELI
jgi:hypothetical protein